MYHWCCSKKLIRNIKDPRWPKNIDKNKLVTKQPEKYWKCCQLEKLKKKIIILEEIKDNCTTGSYRVLLRHVSMHTQSYRETICCVQGLSKYISSYRLQALSKSAKVLTTLFFHPISTNVHLSSYSSIVYPHIQSIVPTTHATLNRSAPKLLISTFWGKQCSSLSQMLTCIFQAANQPICHMLQKYRQLHCHQESFFLHYFLCIITSSFPSNFIFKIFSSLILALFKMDFNFQ